MDYGYLSLLPALIAVVFALAFREVLLALFFGLFVGEWIVQDGDFFTAIASTLERIISQFQEGWIVKTLIFALLVGAIVRLLSVSGAIEGFIHWIMHKRQLVRSGKSALLLAYISGLIIFIESSITSLISGMIAKPLTDRYGICREKLAYVCDSTSAPVCSLIIFNAWGALLLGLITAQVSAGVIQGQPITLLLQAVFFNFYAIITLLMVLYIILSGRDFSLMQKAQHRFQQPLISPKKHAQNSPKDPNNNALNESSLVNFKIQQHKRAHVLDMLLPLAVLMTMVPIGLWISGEGDILQGSGSTSIFWAVLTTLCFMLVYYVARRLLSLRRFMQELNVGAGNMIGIVAILLLAITLGDVMKALHTGDFLASVVNETISAPLLPVLVFLLSAIMAFATGTSWGTFSIMMPIAIPLAVSLDAPLALTMGAVISGGVFGDHSSVISDTSIISSMAADCEHIEHVKTQLPYALLSGSIAALLFLGVAYLLV